MKRITTSGLVDRRCAGNRKEYFPGFGVVDQSTVASYFDDAFKKYKAKNRLKLAAMERFHGMGENKFKFRSTIPK